VQLGGGRPAGDENGLTLNQGQLGVAASGGTGRGSCDRRREREGRRGPKPDRDQVAASESNSPEYSGPPLVEAEGIPTVVSSKGLGRHDVLVSRVESSEPIVGTDHRQIRKK
jgi:hypothetical protein